MKISAFGDEIATDFEEQLIVLKQLNIPMIDIRQAWGVRVNEFTPEHIEKIAALLKQYDITVACLGSPIGKSPISQPLDIELDNLKRVADVGHGLGTRNVRMFSFYPDGDVTQADVDLAIERLTRLCDEAQKLEMTLLLENEKRLVGDIPERCLTLMQAIDRPNFRFIWDPANFVQCGAEEQVDKWWDALSPYTTYIHIKDAKLADATVTPAGEGDGQVDELLQKLVENNYTGVLSLEPHLQEALESSGYSGPDLMKVAVDALRKLMRQNNITETRP